MDLTAFIAAVEADEKAGLHQASVKSKEAAEDAYFEAWGRELDEYPIGALRVVGPCR